MLNNLLLRCRRRSCWLSFTDPVSVHVARTAGEVVDALAACDAALEAGLYTAGYIAYEAAPAFDDALPVRNLADDRLPLAVLGTFTAPAETAELPATGASAPAPLRWTTHIDLPTYRERIAAIHAEIAAGNTYQINFTIRLSAVGDIEPLALFHAIAADAEYAALIDCDDFAVVSASPELFFTLDGDVLVSRPMKGTAPRGLTMEQDRSAALALSRSEKDRAENVMIADMLRNDMGRIARPGSVRVTELAGVEKHPTVWQMTSTIEADTDASIPEIFTALFPCASITGAPKRSSMGIIASLEDAPREVYTGTIGYAAPGREAQFNVAIRTAWLDRRDRRYTYGTGGGIVWDSYADDEFEECRTKTRVLARVPQEQRFELLETLRWANNGGYLLLAYHLERLKDSAEYFDFACDIDRVDAALASHATRFSSTDRRVRLCVARDGRITIEDAPLPNDAARPVALALSANPIDETSPFLYHKTTHRAMYDAAKAGIGDADDALLYNRQGLVTETTIANVLMRIGDDLVTPPVVAGLLAGTERRRLLETGAVIERDVHIDELGDVDEIWLANSVRGRYPAVLRSTLAPGLAGDQGT